MEGAVLSTQNNNRFRTHLKNAATVLCARTLPKARCSEQSANFTQHHTYPRTSPPKRTPISCKMEPFIFDLPATTSFQSSDDTDNDSTIKTKWMTSLKGALTR